MTDLIAAEAQTEFDTIEQAVADIAAGRAVVVVDGPDRENEGDLIFAAEMATPELLAFMVRHTSGFICAPLVVEDADRLELPPMYHVNQDRRGTAYTVTVDAREGVSTGISAADRRTPSGCWPTRTRWPPTWPAPVTSCRCGPSRAGYCAGPGTPRPPWTWRNWPACARPGCCASWSTTTAP